MSNRSAIVAGSHRIRDGRYAPRVSSNEVKAVMSAVAEDLADVKVVWCPDACDVAIDANFRIPHAFDEKWTGTRDAGDEGIDRLRSNDGSALVVNHRREMGFGSEETA